MCPAILTALLAFKRLGSRVLEEDLSFTWVLTSDNSRYQAQTFMGDCCDLPECLDELSNYSLENGLNTRLPPAPGFSADSCTPSLHLCTPNTRVCGISPSQGWTLAFSSPRMNLP